MPISSGTFFASFLPNEPNSIETALLTCNLWSGQSVRYILQVIKLVLIEPDPQIGKKHICKWISFGILTFVIIKEMVAVGKSCVLVEQMKNGWSKR